VREAAIVDAIVALAAGLGLGTIAEGIETEAQFSFLRAAGCSLFQGPLIGRPISIDRFTKTYLRPAAE